MKKNRAEVIAYINGLKAYEGYVQFSHRPIDLKRDLFPRANDIADEKGFVYEAHFYKDNQSIMIRQINDGWIVSQTDTTDAAFEVFHGISDLKIRMAQIWKPEADELCEGMSVMKLKKVVFAGFEKDEK